jgi:HlyD family secretion protein
MAITRLFRNTQSGIAKRASEEAAPALLEFQSPTAALIAQPMPVSGRATIWIIAAAVLSGIAIMSVYAVDRVVTVPGKVVAQTPNIVVQPLETAIVRSINVQEGQVVHTGDLLARLDPTFAAAAATSNEAQMTSLQAEVDRLTAEAKGESYVPDGSPASEVQAMIFAQRHAERTAKLETYRQKIESARSKLAQTLTDIAGYAEQYKDAQAKETMRRELERLQIGSKLNTLDAAAQRAELARNLQAANAGNLAAKSDLDGLIAERDAYLQQTQAETSQQLTEQARKLADAREQWSKANLRRKLVDLRAERDAVVLSVAKVSVGSVMQSGDEFITLVPTDAALEVEANISGRDAGFVQLGDATVIKFDTFPYTTYGYARGTVRNVSADAFTNPQHARERPTRPYASVTEASRDAAFYRAKVSLDETLLHNLPAAFRMTPGMPVTADIKVGKRTVLAYLLSRVVPTLSEGMREP